MNEMGAKALQLGIPLGVQLDLTYRCNERCVHCYLDHEDHGELTTAEVIDLLEQLSDAGVFFLTLSGGEIFMRKDLLEILAHARKLMFSIKLKTNAVMINAAKAQRVAQVGVESVQISLYSHRAEVHDEITKVQGSFVRTVEGARLLKAEGVKVSFANVLMQHNAQDYPQVQALAAQMGIGFNIDPTITPMMDGDRSILNLNIDAARLREVMHDASLVGKPEEFCAPPSGALPLQDAMETIPCSAGHTACYISPYGDLYPCVQFPLPSGNIRKSKFLDIWQNSPQLAEVRAIRISDLDGCSSCTHGSSCSRCPGLAYMEGNMRGPSTQDCEKSFARTGVPSENLRRAKAKPASGAAPAMPPRPATEHPIQWSVRK
jgi:radical SAM protein with 4Fe4S-binding SPASM domain